MNSVFRADGAVETAAARGKIRRLAVIPSDPLQAYKQKGNGSWLQGYYNPAGCAEEVFALSPFEEKEYSEFGLRVVPTRPGELKERITQLGIDVVRAYGGHFSGEMACTNKVPGVPVVVSVHDTNPLYLLPSVRRADVVLCMSQTVKELVQRQIGHPRAWVLPNRVDFDVMRPGVVGDCADGTPWSGFKYRVLHVGRKTEQKNLDTLLHAMKLLGDDYCLIAIGNSEDARYETLAQGLGIEARCFFIDSVENRHLPEFYHLADCMCTPSRWEGFGLVFIEALACQAVVVTSNIAPMNEYIRNGYNGVLTDHYLDPGALADSIVSACCDQQLRRTIRENARQSVARFAKEEVDRCEEAYYLRVLEMSAAGQFRPGLLSRILPAKLLARLPSWL